MSKKKKQPTKKKIWQPLHQTSPDILKQKNSAKVALVKSEFPMLSDDEIKHQIRCDEMWGNDRYTVTITHLDSRERDGYLEVGVHNHNRTTIMPWSHMQQIKNEIAGPEREAVMMYPAESRLVDTANEYWIYVYPIGEAPMMAGLDRDGKEVSVPVGMNLGRHVQYQDSSPLGNAKQGTQLEVKNGN